jgi:hypothetical protein
VSERLNPIRKPTAELQGRVKSSWAFRAAAGAAVMLAFALAARSRQASSAAPVLRFAHGGNAAEVPMELASDAVFVPAQLNQGRASGWLLDTGSRRTVADAELVADADGNTASGAAEIALPGLAIRAVDLDKQSFQALGPWYGQRVNGVIGDDVLAHLVVELDYSRSSIELYAPGAFRPHGKPEKLAIQWIDGLPAIRAKLRLGGRTMEGNFAINTGGSNGVAVSSAFLAAYREFPYAGKTLPGTAVDKSGDRKVLLAQAEWLRLGSVNVREPIVAIENGKDQTASSGKKAKKSKDTLDGWIGGQILRKFSVVLDFPQSRLLLEPNRDFIFPIEADASGATIIAGGDDLRRFVVRRVLPGSPADQAGLMPGDEITWVGTDRASSLSLDQMRELLRKPGDSPILVVRRLGRTIRVQLHLRSLLLAVPSQRPGSSRNGNPGEEAASPRSSAR